MILDAVNWTTSHEDDLVCCIISLVAVAIPILGVYGSIVPFLVWSQSLSIYITGAVIVLSLVWTLVNNYVFPGRMGKASELHPWEVEEDSTTAPRILREILRGHQPHMPKLVP